MALVDDCESRLRHGVPLRLDQTTGLLEEGINASLVEQAVEDDEDTKYEDCTCNWCRDPDPVVEDED